MEDEALAPDSGGDAGGVANRACAGTVNCVPLVKDSDVLLFCGPLSDGVGVAGLRFVVESFGWDAVVEELVS